MVQDWLQDYQARHGEPARLPAIAGYNVVDLFVAAAEAAGRELTVDSLVAALNRLRDHRTIFGSAPVSFSPTCHLGSTGVFVARVEDGRWRRETGFLPTQPRPGCPAAP